MVVPPLPAITTTTIRDNGIINFVFERRCSKTAVEWKMKRPSQSYLAGIRISNTHFILHWRRQSVDACNAMNEPATMQSVIKRKYWVATGAYFAYWLPVPCGNVRSDHHSINQNGHSVHERVVCLYLCVWDRKSSPSLLIDRLPLYLRAAVSARAWCMN